MDALSLDLQLRRELPAAAAGDEGSADRRYQGMQGERRSRPLRLAGGGPGACRGVGGRRTRVTGRGKTWAGDAVTGRLWNGGGLTVSVGR